jgi:acyl-CoA reductase-like NAD-dependent aldehyde dehydrogenase
VQTQLIIDNKPQDAAEGRTFERTHPLSGDLVTRAAAAGVGDAIAAVDSAAAAFTTWSRTGPSERRAILLKAADIMDQRTPELIEAMGLGSAPPPCRPASTVS